MRMAQSSPASQHGPDPPPPNPTLLLHTESRLEMHAQLHRIHIDHPDLIPLSRPLFRKIHGDLPECLSPERIVEEHHALARGAPELEGIHDLALHGRPSVACPDFPHIPPTRPDQCRIQVDSHQSPEPRFRRQDQRPTLAATEIHENPLPGCSLEPPPSPPGTRPATPLGKEPRRPLAPRPQATRSPCPYGSQTTTPIPAPTTLRTLPRNGPYAMHNPTGASAAYPLACPPRDRSSVTASPTGCGEAVAAMENSCEDAGRVCRSAPGRGRFGRLFRRKPSLIPFLDPHSSR